MSLSPEATKLFNHLPQDGTTVGGITLQRELSLSKLEYQKARDELKAEGLVVSGRGRGGSLARIEGVQPKEEKVVTKAERMAHAREIKVAKSRAEKETAELIEKILDWIHAQGFTQVEKRDLAFSDGRPVFAVWATWEDGRYYAKMHLIPQLEYDKLRANYII